MNRRSWMILEVQKYLQIHSVKWRILVRLMHKVEKRISQTILDAWRAHMWRSSRVIGPTLTINYRITACDQTETTIKEWDDRNHGLNSGKGMRSRHAVERVRVRRRPFQVIQTWIFLTEAPKEGSCSLWKTICSTMALASHPGPLEKAHSLVEGYHTFNRVEGSRHRGRGRPLQRRRGGLLGSQGIWGDKLA